MSDVDDQREESPMDAKQAIIKTILKPLGRIFSNEVSFILTMILFCISYAAWMVYEKFTEFARVEIPKHIEAINEGHKQIAEQFSRELQSQRDHYVELRKLDNENISRVERLLDGRRPLTTPSISSGNGATP